MPRFDRTGPFGMGPFTGWGRGTCLERPFRRYRRFSKEDEIDDLPFVTPTTVTAFYKIIATPEELEEVEMAFNSIGIIFERREV